MKRVVVIGGCVIDLFAYPHQAIVMHDSNPGYLKRSLGGVGRNIAENLCRLSVDTTLITVLGKDDMGDFISRSSDAIGLKLIYKPVDVTPTYIAIMDEHNEDLVGVAAMDQILQLDQDFLVQHKTTIASADILVIDTNLSDQTLDYIFSTHNQSTYVDAISSQKAIRIKPYLAKIHTIKLNLIEAELLTGITFETIEDLNRMGDYLLEHGVREIFITLGDKGAYHTTRKEALYYPGKPTKIFNATGAGDAFFAGAIYAKLMGLPSLVYAMANARINLMDDKAVASDLNEALLKKTVKEFL